MNRTTSDSLSIADLERWTFRGTALAVLGQPIAHSLSPRMHNAALQALSARDPRLADWRYFRMEVAPERLREALDKLHRAGFAGLNLTVPHKVLAAEMIGRIDDAAAAAGAVNTLRRTADGWEGFSTDGYGLSIALKERLGVRIPGAQILLLGAGGAARSAAAECLHQKCAALWIANRTPANLETLGRVLSSRAGAIPVRTFSPKQPPRDLPDGLVVINATSAGLRHGDAAPIDLGLLPKPAAVFDMIYNPPVTALLEKAKSLGVPAANGLSMLVHQGARALELWTGVPAAQAAPLMARSLEEASTSNP